MKSQNKTRDMCLAAVMAAIIFIFTAFFHIPTALGYIHVGDGFIYLAAALLPAPYAVAAAGIGGALSDILSGYAMWAPGTLVIKVLTALCFTSRRETIVNKRNLMGVIPAVIICCGGYCAYEAMLTGQFLAAAAGIPGNIMQVAGSTVIFAAIGKILDTVSFKKKMHLGAAVKESKKS